VTVEDVRFSELMKPTERQREAFKASDSHRFTLYGGAGGGGKSYFLRWWCLRQLLKLYAETGIEGIRVGLFSMDYPTLTDRQISRINREFPEWMGSLRKTQTDGYNFQVLPEFGGGTIALRNLDDPSKYRSAEFAAIAVEELTENTKETFDDLRFRLRWPGISRPCFVGATNPGGVGHHWVKDFWIDARFPKELQSFRDEFKYVPAKVLDNPHITSNYYEDLLSLPDAKRRALAEGDWSVPEGQYFTNFERDERSIHPSVLGQIIKPWWPKWISMDWGFKHHSSIHWHTTGDVHPEEASLFGKKIDAPKKYVFTYREKVISLAQEGSSEEQLANDIVRFSGSDKISRFFLSPDAFGKKTSAHPVSEIFRQVFRTAEIGAPEPADNARVVGWRFMYQLIQNDQWLISEACPEALNAVPALQYDKDGSNIEDIQKTDHLYDDVGDELRYGLQSMLNNSKMPFSVKLAEAVAAATNATVASMVHMKMLAERKKKTQRYGRQY
jgi:phage terminase large subunit